MEKQQPRSSAVPTTIALAGILRVFASTFCLLAWVYLHRMVFAVTLDFNVITKLVNPLGVNLSNYDTSLKLHQAFPLSIVCRFIWLCMFRGLKVALDEVIGIISDILKPIHAATRLAYASSSLYRSLEQLALSLVIWVCYITSYGPFCLVTVNMIVDPFIYAGRLHQPWGRMTKLVSKKYLIQYRIQFVVATMMIAGLIGALVFLSHHRYFSHRAFKTSRVGQLILAVCASVAAQRGPLWWASIHGRHHRYCETDVSKDPHNPENGFFWSHGLWTMDRDHFYVDKRYGNVSFWISTAPELLLVDAFTILLQVGTKSFLFHVLIHLEQLLGWKSMAFKQENWYYAIEAGLIITSHASHAVNSICHGNYPPIISWFIPKGANGKEGEHKCTALDRPLVALLLGGDGFHAYHHDFPRSAQHGPWYMDPSYCFVCVLEKLGLVWDVQHRKKVD